MRKATEQLKARHEAAIPATHGGYRVRGRVQGVGFRWWTRSQAVRLGLTGTVRNREDGSVEVWARGDPKSLTELRRLLAVGPPGALVEQVEGLPAVAPVTPDGFRILR